MEKHTDGPWMASKCDNRKNANGDNLYLVSNSPLSRRYKMRCEVGGEDNPKANAHLIAAAPEMLEMLKECREYALTEKEIEEDNGRNASLEITRVKELENLIAKAEGKS